MAQPSKALDASFRLANLAIIPAWGLMIFAPNSRWTAKLINSDGLLYGLGGTYAVMLAGAMAENPAGGAAVLNPTLENIGKLFKEGGPKGTFAGWMHYLAFDFFVGRWIFNDARSRQIPHALIVPALILTLMSGPLGFLYYKILLKLRGEQ